MNDHTAIQTRLDAHIEALLFAMGGPMRIAALARVLGCKEQDIRSALDTLAARLKGGGLALTQTQDTVALTTNDLTSPTVAQSRKENLEGDLGQAALEVLAVLLYRGPATRARIDHIRGVNSASTIRTLLSRGMIERAKNKEDAREFLYHPTTELLAHLGVSNTKELPDFDAIEQELTAFESQQETAKVEAPDENREEG